MDLKSLAWWLWLAVLTGLGYGIFVHPVGFLYAVIAQIINLQTYVFLDKSFVSFSVQIRLAILGILLTGQIPGVAWLYWVPFIGLTVRELTGYCFLARVMSLLPWNRSEPFSMALVKRRIFSPPTKGSILKV